jgi:hypothetical protein
MAHQYHSEIQVFSPTHFSWKFLQNDQKFFQKLKKIDFSDFFFVTYIVEGFFNAILIIT